MYNILCRDLPLRPVLITLSLCGILCFTDCKGQAVADSVEKWKIDGVLLALQDSRITCGVFAFLKEQPELVNHMDSLQRQILYGHIMKSGKAECYTSSYVLGLLASTEVYIPDSIFTFLNSENDKSYLKKNFAEGCSINRIKSRSLIDSLITYHDSSLSPLGYDERPFIEALGNNQDNLLFGDKVVRTLLKWLTDESGRTSEILSQFGPSTPNKNEVIEVMRRAPFGGYHTISITAEAIGVIGRLGIRTPEIEKRLRIFLRNEHESIQFAAAASMLDLELWDPAIDSITQAYFSRKNWSLDREIIRPFKCDTDWYVNYLDTLYTHLFKKNRRYPDPDERMSRLYQIIDGLAKAGKTNSLGTKVLEKIFDDLGHIRYYFYKEPYFEPPVWAAIRLLENGVKKDTLIKYLESSLTTERSRLGHFHVSVLETFKNIGHPGFKRLLDSVLIKPPSYQFFPYASLFDKKLSSNHLLSLARNSIDNLDHRVMCYILSGGELTFFLAFYSSEDDLNAVLSNLSLKQAQVSLNRVHEALPLFNTLQYFKADFHAGIEKLILSREKDWEPEDWEVINGISDRLKGSAVRPSIEAAILKNQSANWLVKFGITLGTHLLFWICLLFLYPRYKVVQSIFFWNKWVRQFAGLFYIEPLLTYVPLFRRILLKPFQPLFIKDADLDTFDQNSYYRGLKYQHMRSGEVFDQSNLQTKLKGQVIIEGASGLGKTMLLRFLILNTNRIVVYLPAEKCANGVIAAIKEKIFIYNETDDFLKRLIYIGAIDVYIDGLNEVSPQTQAVIRYHCESFATSNVIITTQPMEWKVPPTVSVFQVQPLNKNEILNFLLSQKGNMPEGSVMSPEEFTVRCEDFVEHQMGPIMSTKGNSIYRVLSNPMDLTFVVIMLGLNKRPDLLNLQQQQFEIMAADYSYKNHNEPFPLKKFSRVVYEMRLNDRQEIDGEEFKEELLCMERFKMVYRRVLDSTESTINWYFRHDKVQEYFIVKSFLGAKNNLISQHLGDPRFSGVYFLLGFLLPLEEAGLLERQLINHAVDNSDHTVSDQFIQILRDRKAS